MHPGLVHSFTAHLYSEGQDMIYYLPPPLEIHCHLQMHNLVHIVAEYLLLDICISVCTHQVRCMFDVQADLRTHKHVDADMDTYYIQPSAVRISGEYQPDNFNNLISRLWRWTSHLPNI